MDGYIFEELVNTLFQKMGFETELTNKSGDGGVDIIARYNKPIFRGKYLIQCKYWENQVGEPPIRDLYGVCLSDQANKGILVTNSGFTDSALSFSEGKNIELIDGDTLQKLMKEYDVSRDINSNPNKSTHFTIQENFELDKYRYLVKRIENERREANHYIKLREFFFENLLKKDWDILRNGLLDEFIALNEEYIKRFCKNTKVGTEEKKALNYLNAMLYLYKGELFKSVEMISDLNLLKKIHPFALMPHWYYFDGTFRNDIRNPIILSYLLIIFRAFEFNDGIKLIQEKIDEGFDEILRKMSTGLSFFPYYDENKELFSNFIEDILNSQFEDIFIPTDYEAGKILKYYGYEFSWDEGVTFNVNELIDNMWDREKIKESLNDIKVVLSL
ncbi:restriction endonuclease [Piscibacillus sp. B03]|uniref:restriction endonuclease n=1 Tax=Piscibacillus sp. B03 TaxID=3457430 RepID=UPI003FCE05AB